MITDMVKAHLENVKSVLLDLHSQKKNIENEITKLESYLEKGSQELNLYENSLTRDSNSKNQQSLTNVTKHYLGE
jgi:predicted  nucleic acid-binding Zn-ribbon protein